MSEFILEAFNLSKKYDRSLFRGINFSLKDGELIFIKGNSGSGKSVFLKCLISLVPLDEGNILYRGKELDHKALPLFRSKVKYLGQEISREEKDVLNFLQLPFQFQVSKEKKFLKDLVVDLLEKIGFSSTFLSKKMVQLSGGEGQVVKLIQSIIMDPEVLLLDEPTSAMDQELKQKMENLIFLYQKSGGAVVWVSHENNHMEMIKAKRYLFPSMRLEQNA